MTNLYYELLYRIALILRQINSSLTYDKNFLVDTVKINLEHRLNYLNEKISKSEMKKELDKADTGIRKRGSVPYYDPRLNK